MKIAIIDDEPLAISSLRRMIETIPATAIVGSARSAAWERRRRWRAS